MQGDALCQHKGKSYAVLPDHPNARRRPLPAQREVLRSVARSSKCKETPSASTKGSPTQCCQIIQMQGDALCQHKGKSYAMLPDHPNARKRSLPAQREVLRNVARSSKCKETLSAST